MQSVIKTFPGARWGRTRLTALDRVSFDARDGEILGIVGANGAGKTTVLHSIAGLLTPDAGVMLLDGRVLNERVARREVALCSSADRSFYYRLTLRANLEFFGALGGLRGELLARRIDHALKATDLCGVADRRYSSCSTGMRQRLTFARALLSDARLLLLDEPTRALDALHAEHLHRFVRGTLRDELGKTLIVATNLLEEAWKLCDRVVLLASGRVVAVDTPAALNERFGRRSSYRMEIPSPEALFMRGPAV